MYSDESKKAILDGGHTGATWRIRLNCPCAAAMRPFCQITLATCYYRNGVSWQKPCHGRVRRARLHKVQACKRATTDMVLWRRRWWRPARCAVAAGSSASSRRPCGRCPPSTGPRRRGTEAECRRRARTTSRSTSRSRRRRCCGWSQRARRATLQRSQHIHTHGLLKATFHYAVWSQTGSKLVADMQLAGIWPII